MHGHGCVYVREKKIQTYNTFVYIASGGLILTHIDDGKQQYRKNGRKDERIEWNRA